MSTHAMRDAAATSGREELDAVIIGAGYGGMYALHRLRRLGLRLRVYDEAGGVGGTWWWNRYPGARVDIPSAPYYCYTFSDELVREWDWTETQPDQPSVLAYLDFVADKLDLRRDIRLRTRVRTVRFDDATLRWHVETNTGEQVSAQFLICAVGTLSAAYRPNLPGIDDFAGECYHTGRWPYDRTVEFAGKRVGVIGTGSSGVQVIPEIAREAEHLTVFQRTPQYTIPANNRPLDPDLLREHRENWPRTRQEVLQSPLGVPASFMTFAERSALDDTPEQRRLVYEAFWQKGGMHIQFGAYRDILTDPEANRTLADFARSKIREIVRDPDMVRKLLPDYYIGTKRLLLDSGYYETFNRDNVTLVDLREDPIETLTPTGVRTRDGEHPLDALVLATGYDAMTGALWRLNPVGRGGLTLRRKWADGFRTHLGMMIAGFPNLFMVHGPESPSVLYNMPLGAELQGDWIADCMTHLRARGLATIEPSPEAEPAWGAQVQDLASHTLFPLTDSWYTGANIPGKPRRFGIYLDAPGYFQTLTEVAQSGYEGFVVSPALAGIESVAGAGAGSPPGR